MLRYEDVRIFSSYGLRLNARFSSEFCYAFGGDRCLNRGCDVWRKDFCLFLKCWAKLPLSLRYFKAMILKSSLTIFLRLLLGKGLRNSSRT